MLVCLNSLFSPFISDCLVSLSVVWVHNTKDYYVFLIGLCGSSFLYIHDCILWKRKLDVGVDHTVPFIEAELRSTEI